MKLSFPSRTDPKDRASDSSGEQGDGSGIINTSPLVSPAFCRRRRGPWMFTFVYLHQTNSKGAGDGDGEKRGTIGVKRVRDLAPLYLLILSQKRGGRTGPKKVSKLHRDLASRTNAAKRGARHPHINQWENLSIDPGNDYGLGKYLRELLKIGRTGCLRLSRECRGNPQVQSCFCRAGGSRHPS